MREAINLDGFMTPEEVLEAMRPASGKWHEGICERLYNRLPKDLKW